MHGGLALARDARRVMHGRLALAWDARRVKHQAPRQFQRPGCSRQPRPPLIGSQRCGCQR